MSLTLELEPEVESALSTLAAASGTSVSEYIADIVIRQSAIAKPPNDDLPESFVELCAPIRALFKDGELDFSRRPAESRTIDFS